MKYVKVKGFCGIHGSNERFFQNFSPKILRKETNWEIESLVKDDIKMDHI
jgi:hypothetical protein